MIPKSYITKLQRRAKAASQDELIGFITQLRDLLEWTKNLYVDREARAHLEAHATWEEERDE